MYLHDLPFVAHGYHPKLLKFLHVLQYIAAYLERALAWFSGETWYIVFFSDNFHSHLVARSCKPIMCTACSGLSSENANSIKLSVKSKRLILELHQWHPRRIDCVCLSNPSHTCSLGCKRTCSQTCSLIRLSQSRVFNLARIRSFVPQVRTQHRVKTTLHDKQTCW